MTLGGADGGLPVTAIFLHSGWRTGSTYLWSKFRAAPGTAAFYEPLHECLRAGIGPALEVRVDPERSHHPPLSAPYFAEYRPLIEGGGIRHFRPDFSYRRFFLEPGEPAPELLRYVRQLVDLAAADGCVPVLGFSRSLGRAGWLAQAFPSVNLLVTRAPRRQWASIVHQRDRYRIAYFLINQFLICGQNRDHPLIRPLIAAYDIPLVLTGSVEHDFAIYRRLFEGVGDRIGYMVFYHLWRVSNAAARRFADLELDIARLAADPAARAATETAIARLTGLSLSLDDVHGERADVPLPDLDYDAIEAFVDGLDATSANR